MSKKPRRSPTPRDREVEILTNPKLPRRLRLIDGRTGGVVLAVEDAPAAVMSWFEIEQAWLKTNDCGSATGSDCNVPRH
jgi:hypothetical protein